MGTPIKIITFLTGTIYLFGCKPIYDPCNEKLIVYILDQNYKSHFSKCNSSGYPAPMQSSSGLMDNFYEYTYINFENDTSYYQFCTKIKNEFVHLSYYAPVYNLPVTFELIQKKDGTYLIYYLNDYYKSKRKTYVCKWNLLTKQTYPVLIRTTSYPLQDSTTTVLPQLDTIGTYHTGIKAYNNVYRISNSLMPIYGNNFSIRELYFDKDYGLLQYTQNNGVVWILK